MSFLVILTSGGKSWESSNTTHHNVLFAMRRSDFQRTKYIHVNLIFSSPTVSKWFNGDGIGLFPLSSWHTGHLWSKFWTSYVKPSHQYRSSTRSIVLCFPLWLAKGEQWASIHDHVLHCVKAENNWVTYTTMLVQVAPNHPLVQKAITGHLGHLCIITRGALRRFIFQK